MGGLGSWLLFGDLTFDEADELEGFRYKFLIVAMLVAGLMTAIFILSSYGQVKPVGTAHLVSMHVFTLATFGCWWTLRGRRHRFLRVAWCFEAAAIWGSTSSLLFTEQDELRVLWFYTNVPGVFMVLGRRAGWAVTGLSLAIILGANLWTAQPYSLPAMMTAVFSLLYLAVFFDLFGSRAVSFYERMREAIRELEHVAGHDPLTGALNARAYRASCEALVRVAQRAARPFSVLFVDLDHFKAVNDRHGHAAGDEVLKSAVGAMRRAVRSSDLLGRIGGEEFVVFLPDTDRAGAMRAAENVREAIRGMTVALDGASMTVTASVGVASNHDFDESLSAVQRRADKALYAAKAQGRDRVAFGSA